MSSAKNLVKAGALAAAGYYTGGLAGTYLGTLEGGAAGSLTGAAVGSAAGAAALPLLAAGKAPAAAPRPIIPSPAIAKPAVMPVPDDQAVMLARRRALSAAYSRSGRQSTILSDAVSETLG